MTNETPQEAMNHMITGYWVTQMIYVAAKLGLADHVKDSPRLPSELAPLTNTDASSLYRLLRALASIGVFKEDEAGRFASTPLAECLRSDNPNSQRALAIMSGEEHYRAWGDLLYSVQTGKKSFDMIYGMPIFEFLSKNVEQAKTFDAAMVGVHGRETSAMISAYDFSNFSVLADIGGGNGSLLTTVLQKHNHLRGILYDLPGVAVRARERISALELADRCEVIGGSFFESIPPGADAYLMRHILHDWSDKEAELILRNTRAAMHSDNRLLVIEGVIEPGNAPSFGKLLDLTMLTLAGGKERTATEFHQLFEAGGFELTRIIPTEAEVCIIEGRPA